MQQNGRSHHAAACPGPGCLLRVVGGTPRDLASPPTAPATPFVTPESGPGHKIKICGLAQAPLPYPKGKTRHCWARLSLLPRLLAADIWAPGQPRAVKLLSRGVRPPVHRRGQEVTEVSKGPECPRSSASLLGVGWGAGWGTCLEPQRGAEVGHSCRPALPPGLAAGAPPRPAAPWMLP